MQAHENVFSHAGGEVEENPDSVRCDDFPLHCHCLVCSWAEAMWQQIQASRQAAESNCIDNNAQDHARTITHAFMHTLMYLSMHESEHALLAHTPHYRRTIVPVYVQTKSCACTRENSILREYTQARTHTLPPSLSLTKGRSCVKLRCAALMNE